MSADPRYACYCDGDCENGVVAEPWSLCDECKRFGHRPLPTGFMGLTPSDIRKHEPECEMTWTHEGPCAPAAPEEGTG